MLFPTNTTNLLPFIHENGSKLYDLNQADHRQLLDAEDELETFIQLNYQTIKKIPVTDSAGRAYLFFLLDLCERLRLRSSFAKVLQVIQQNEIEIGSRLQAAALFNIVPGNSAYIERFKRICELIQNAIDFEDDNKLKALATFCNYYISVLDVHPNWITELRKKIEEHTADFAFLNDEFINQIIGYNVDSPFDAISRIEEAKDNLFARQRISIFRPIQNIGPLTESNTNYSRQLNGLDRISFRKIREVALLNIESSSQLSGRGVEPLTNEEELFIYLKSFGNMHYSKLKDAIEHISHNDLGNEIEIIDWGCGQAMGVMVLGECMTNLNDRVAKINITLIEPSEIAIKRAALHAGLFFPNANIKTVVKYLDDITDDDICTSATSTKIHLFSNILDVEYFNLHSLMRRIHQVQEGKNIFICVSPDINDFKTQRLFDFRNYFKEEARRFKQLAQHRDGKNDHSYWLCNNAFRNNFCLNHGNAGCQQKWTRVTEVFETEL